MGRIFLLDIKKFMQRKNNNYEPIYADLKKKFTSLNNFIVINSLCNFEVTTAYNICTSVHKSLSVNFHKTVCTWALNVDVRCIWNILFLKLLYIPAFCSVLSVVRHQYCYWLSQRRYIIKTYTSSCERTKIIW